MRKILILLIPLVAFSLSSQDEARLLLGSAVEDWIDGRFEEAMTKISSALQMPVDPFDLPKVYYIKAKLEVDTGRVETAFKDLRSMLAVSLGTPEIISYLREMEYLSGRRNVERNLKVEHFLKINGIKSGIEYFYTVEDVAIWGDEIYAIDRVNSRLLIYNRSRLEKAVFLPFRPLSVETSPSGKIYVSGIGGLYIYDEKLTEVATGLRSPLIAGFDRSGKLWGVDGEEVFWIDSAGLHTELLRTTLMPLDCEVNENGLWILDVLGRRIVLLSKDDFEVLRTIPLPVETRAFELTPLGSAFLLSTDGKIYYFKDFKDLVEVGISSSGIVGFEYDFPILITSDWRKREIDLSLVTEGEPMFVRLVSIERNGGRLTVKVRVEGFEGEDMNFADDFLYAEVDGDRVKPKVERVVERTEAYKSGKDFLSDRLPLVDRRSGIDVLIPADSYHTVYDTVTLRSKGVRLFVFGKPPESLLRISEMSGGERADDLRSGWRVLWKLIFSYVPDVTVRVHTVTVGVEFFGKSYTDTFYVVDKGVVEEGE